MGPLVIDPAMMRDRSINAVLGAVAEAGFDAVEWAPRDDFLPAGRAPQASPAAVRELRSAAERAGIAIASVAAFYDWSSPDLATRAEAVARFRRAIDVCGDLGCNKLNTELKGDIAQPGASEEAFRRSLDQLLPDAERAGILISVEPHPYDFIESSNAAVDLVRSVGSRQLGYLYCVPHTYIMGGDTATMIRYAGDAITHVHLADSFRPTRYITNPQNTGVRVHQHLDIGLGEVDFPLLFSSLATVGYQGLYTIAVFAHPERALASFRQNRERVLGLLPRAHRPRAAKG